MAGSCSSLRVMMLTVLVLAVAVAGQAQDQTCASKLVPCFGYLNSTTTPPNTCCDPIKEAVANDLPCLCGLYNNPSFLSGIGIDVTQALRLPQLCGISSDATACKNAQAPSGSTTQPPPGTPGGNNAGKIASSGVIGLLLISTCLMLF